MNKKYILLFVGVVILFIIFISVIAFQQKQDLPFSSSLQNQNPAKLQHTSQVNTPTSVTLPPLSNSPKEAARQFYMYYFATLQNPLANGAYKNNPYLSDDLKKSIETLYNNGNSPLLCPQNKRKNIIVGQEVDVYTNNQYMKMETISQAPPGTKDLYRIELESQNGKWLIFDVNCIY